ncbi:hypothetical protein [Agromyces badenianii]|uniref:hypothetical protein n=1 Tax=Agromyces badenianii TaxID=2080742 RepID=UPI000D595C6E|nr:hypothetical protein [Agromyces badenianii]PWC05433.1 hypothetical protein DCE94_03940 [Agromyces badenianii]
MVESIAFQTDHDFNPVEIVTTGAQGDSRLGERLEPFVVLTDADENVTHWLTPDQARRAAARMVRISNDLDAGRDIGPTAMENDSLSAETPINDEAERIARGLVRIVASTDFGPLRAEMTERAIMSEILGAKRLAEDRLLLAIAVIHNLTAALEAMVDEIAGTAGESAD